MKNTALSAFLFLSFSVWVNAQWLPSSAPAFQSFCSDTAYTFDLGSITAPAPWDQVEWAYDAGFRSGSVSRSPARMHITVGPGSVDTIWIRGKDSKDANTSDAATCIMAVYKRPLPPAPPLIQTFSGDQAWTFTYAGIAAGIGGNLIQWSADSHFTDPSTAKSPSDLYLTVPPDSTAAMWIRSVDSLDGCVSDPVMAVGIMRPAPAAGVTYESTMAVCKGESIYIPVYNSRRGTRYALRIGTPMLPGMMGNNATLQLSAGSADSDMVVTVIATDTATGITAMSDSAIVIMVVPPVAEPVFISGDQVIYRGDTAWPRYTAIANGAIRIIYSIDSGGGAAIDPLTGRTSDIRSNFTVRATAAGLPSCGERTATLQVRVTDIGMPSVPMVQPVLIDTPQQITMTIANVQAGANADRVEWSRYEDFRRSQKAKSPATISVDADAPGDVILYIRSRKRKKKDSGKSLPVHLTSQIRLLSAGLMDKSSWVYDAKLSDEFSYTNRHDPGLPALPGDIGGQDRFQQKWALNFCWENSRINCDPAACENHALDTPGMFNFGNYDGLHTDDSGGEVSFAGGVAHLTTTKLSVPFLRDCASQYGSGQTYRGTFTYKTGMLALRQTINLTRPCMMEMRCRLPAGGYPSFWLFEGGGIELDMIDNPGQPPNQNKLGMLDWFNSYTDDNGPQHPACGSTFNKVSACDFTEEWHTFTCVLTGSEIMYFIDGKEMWSRASTHLHFNQTAYLYICLGVTGWFSGSGLDMQVDYFRFYTPARDKKTRTVPCLQNVKNGAPMTIESPNVPTPLHPGSDLLMMRGSPGYSSASVAPSHSIGVTGTGPHSDLYYIGPDHTCHHVAAGSDGSWQDTAITPSLASAPLPARSHLQDIKDFITPVSTDLIYYQSTSDELRFMTRTPAGRQEQAALRDSAGVKSIIRNCAGYISVDKWGSVWYKGKDDNVYNWSPDSQTLRKVTDNGTVNSALTVATCGCLAFYRDFDNNLRQIYSWSGWHDPGVAVRTGNVTDNIVLDEVNGLLYFIGSDSAVYGYSWRYNSVTTGGLFRLGQNSTESQNAGTVCSSYNNAASDLAISPDKNILYYRASDNSLWYFYNDRDGSQNTNQRPHTESWNRTSLKNISVRGPIVLGGSSSGELYYVGSDQKLHNPRWVSADNPADCPSAGHSQPSYFY